MDEHFVMKIVFTDEYIFTNEGLVSIHNLHSWEEENPHAVLERHSQFKFKVNIWISILGTHVTGPYEKAKKLNGVTYLRFLNEELHPILEEIPLLHRMDMCFMPPHFSL